jgi:hypothetical protein
MKWPTHRKIVFLAQQRTIHCVVNRNECQPSLSQMHHCLTGRGPENGSTSANLTETHESCGVSFPADITEMLHQSRRYSEKRENKVTLFSICPVERDIHAWRLFASEFRYTFLFVSSPRFFLTTNLLQPFVLSSSRMHRETSSQKKESESSVFISLRYSIRSLNLLLTFSVEFCHFFGSDFSRKISLDFHRWLDCISRRTPKEMHSRTAYDSDAQMSATLDVISRVWCRGTNITRTTWLLVFNFRTLSPFLLALVIQVSYVSIIRVTECHSNLEAASFLLPDFMADYSYTWRRCSITLLTESVSEWQWSRESLSLSFVIETCCQY